MKRLIPVAAVAMLAAGCANENACAITGHGENITGYVYLVDFVKPSELIDSAKVSNGKFKFSVDAQANQIAAVRGEFASDDEDDSRIFFQPVMLEPGKVTVDIDNGTVSGTPANDAYAVFSAAESNLTQQYYDSKTPEERERLSHEMDALNASSFGANSNNIFGAMLLDELSYDMTGAQTLATIEALPEAVRNSNIVAKVSERAEAKLASDPGQPYIEVSQPDMNGKQVTLSSVIGNPKNKYVLVDFWASWCGPCMMEVPYLLETYAKYHDKGFEIFGISHDTDGERWRNCVKDRKMNWIHVSELHRFDNQAARDYGVRGIPANFLVETSSGKIIATNLRGKALEAKMAELLD